MIHTSQKIKMIKISDILPNPYQIRRNFGQKELSSLCESIKQIGILSPVIVRGISSGYELICGQRRVKASIMAGKKEIPALIIRAGDAQCAQISLIENLQRKNLGLSEEAEGFYNLLSYHKLKKEMLAKFTASDFSYINEKIRFLALSEKVRYKIEENNLPEKFAKELIKLHDEEKQLELIEMIVKDNLSREVVSEIVKETLWETAHRKNKNKDGIKPQRSLKEKMPLYINTVTKTVELLKKSGAKTDFIKNETEEYMELTIKIEKN